MTFPVATHSDTRWLLGSILFTNLCLILLGMISLWVGGLGWIALGWSLWRDKQGHTGWYTSLIPKQQSKLHIVWPSDNDDPYTTCNQIEVQIDTYRNQSWIVTAQLLFLCSGCGLGSLFIGSIEITSSIMVIMLGLGLFQMFSAANASTSPPKQTDPTDNQQVQVHLSNPLTWEGLHTWMLSHQSVLAESGTVRLQSTENTMKIPLALPSNFDQWTLETGKTPVSNPHALDPTS